MRDLTEFIKHNLYISLGNILGAATIISALVGLIYLWSNPGALELGIILLPVYFLFALGLAIIVFLLFLRYPPGYGVLGFLTLLILPILSAAMVSNLLSNLYRDTFTQNSTGHWIVVGGLVIPFLAYLFDYIHRLKSWPKEEETSPQTIETTKHRLSQLEKLEKPR